VPISACPSGKVEDGGLCYVPCEAGYEGVGPVCWQICPPGYIDTGAFCQPEIVCGNNNNCPLDDKCGLFSAKGCVKCPAGFTADGCLCFDGTLFAKKTYGRGVGSVMICAAGLEYDAGLCYPPCPKGLQGIGPVCWASCPASEDYDCGAICVENGDQCTTKVQQVSDALIKLVGQLIQCASVKGCNVSEIGQAIKAIIQQFDLSMCPDN